MIRTMKCLMLGLLSAGLVACGHGTPKVSAAASTVSKSLTLPALSSKPSQKSKAADDALTQKSTADSPTVVGENAAGGALIVADTPITSLQYMPKPLARNDAVNPYLPPYEDQPREAPVNQPSQVNSAQDTSEPTSVATPAKQTVTTTTKQTTVTNPAGTVPSKSTNPTAPTTTPTTVVNTQTQSKTTTTPINPEHTLPSKETNTTTSTKTQTVATSPVVEATPASIFAPAPEKAAVMPTPTVVPATQPAVVAKPKSKPSNMKATEVPVIHEPSTTKTEATSTTTISTATSKPEPALTPASTPSVQKPVALPQPPQPTLPAPGALNNPNNQNPYGQYNQNNAGNNPPPRRKTPAPQSFDEVPVPVLN